MTATPPPVDACCYASITAQALSLLLSAAWLLGRPELRDTALACLEQLLSFAASGRLPHVFSGSGPVHADGGDWLADWAYLLLAALDAYDTTPAPDGARYVEQAVAAAAVLFDRFLDHARGGFFDIEDTPDRPGYLHAREKPLSDNVAVTTGMMRLRHATNEEHYRQVAHHTLSAYAEANRDYGEFAADYAIAVDRYLNPVVEVTVEGQPGQPDAQAMLAAAMGAGEPPPAHQAHGIRRRPLTGAGPRVPRHSLLSSGVRPVSPGRSGARRRNPHRKPIPKRAGPVELVSAGVRSIWPQELRP